MSFKTMTTWETKPPEYPGWYNTLIINNSGTPEVMTMRWNKETGWDNKSWEVRGWCTFPLTCEFLDGNPEVTSENPESTPESTSKDRIVTMTEELLVTFEKHTTVDDSEIIKSVRDIVVAHIYYGGTHADK